MPGTALRGRLRHQGDADAAGHQPALLVEAAHPDAVVQPAPALADAAVPDVLQCRALRQPHDIAAVGLLQHQAASLRQRHQCMARWHCQHHAVGVEDERLQFEDIGGLAHDADVGRALDPRTDHLVAWPLFDQQVDVGMRQQVIGQPIRHHLVQRHCVAQQAQLGLDARRVFGQAALQAIHLQQQRPVVQQQGLAGSGGLNAERLAQQQRHAQAVFHRQQTGAGRRQAQRHGAGTGRDAAGFDPMPEQAQVGEVEMETHRRWATKFAFSLRGGWLCEKRISKSLLAQHTAFNANGKCQRLRVNEGEGTT